MAKILLFNNIFVRAMRLFFVSFLFLFYGCSSYNPYSFNAQLNQQQIREIQTRSYDKKGSLAVMKTMINVLQDEGYIIKNANLDLGFISAEKDVDLEKKWNVFFSTLFSGSQARWKKHALLEVSFNIVEGDALTKVRTNFQVKIFDNKGQIVQVNPITNIEHYHQFFSKLGDALGIPQNV